MCEELSFADPFQSSLLNQLLADAPHLVDVGEVTFLFQLVADAYYVFGGSIGENLKDNGHLAFLWLAFRRRNHLGRH